MMSKESHAKPAMDMPGVKYIDTDHLGPYTCAHAKSFGKEDDPDAAYWGSIILFSHATKEDSRPKYHARGMFSMRVLRPFSRSNSASHGRGTLPPGRGNGHHVDRYLGG
jgi:hypothetical protein